MLVLSAEIVGPSDTPYADGIFKLSINLPERYPINPPIVRFITKIYHPNIDPSGRICLDTLKTRPTGSWTPAVSLSVLLLTIQNLITCPNPDDGLMPNITKHYREDIEGFQKMAREYTLKYARGAEEAEEAEEEEEEEPQAKEEEEKAGEEKEKESSLKRKATVTESDKESSEVAAAKVAKKTSEASGNETTATSSV